MRSFIIAAAFAFAFGPASAAPTGAASSSHAAHCLHGVRCGGACLARGKVCRPAAATVKSGHPKGSSIVHAVSHSSY